MQFPSLADPAIRFATATASGQSEGLDPIDLELAQFWIALNPGDAFLNLYELNRHRVEAFTAEMLDEVRQHRCYLAGTPPVATALHDLHSRGSGEAVIVEKAVARLAREAVWALTAFERSEAFLRSLLQRLRQLVVQALPADASDRLAKSLDSYAINLFLRVVGASDLLHAFRAAAGSPDRLAYFLATDRPDPQFARAVAIASGH